MSKQYPKYPPRWQDYAACSDCGVKSGGICVSLAHKKAVKQRTTPHPGRGFRRRHPYAPGMSKLGRLVVDVMNSEDLSPPLLTERAGRCKNWAINILSEAKHPITLVHAVQLLGLMGYELQHRAVKKDEVHGDGVDAPGRSMGRCEVCGIVGMLNAAGECSSCEEEAGPPPSTDGEHQ
jgi:hypothetical protein